MMTKYAVRYLAGDQWVYRSSGWSDAGSSWEDAQLWSNPRTADKEAKRLREGRPDIIAHWEADKSVTRGTMKSIRDRHGPKPSATVVVVNIGEPA